MATLTDTLLDFVNDSEFRNLPKDAVDAAKHLLIDTIGVAMAGSSAEGIRPAVELMKGWGGKEESTLWVYGSRLPSLHAAFINGMMAHALDFDDCHASAGIHLGASVIPTTLAMAECVQGVSGCDMITSIVLGVEVASRLGLSLLDPDKGWHLTATCGTLSSAAIAGKLLRLDRTKLWNALGIAYSQVSGTFQSVADGVLAKRMQPGFAARAGILSAFLAREGLTGSRDFLEGKYGLFPLYHGNSYNPAILTESLGLSFEISHLAMKPYPCCRCAHAAIDAVLEIVGKTGLTLEEVEKIDVHGSQAMMDLCGRPFEVGRNNAVDAQFSMQYLLASAISRKRVGIEDFSLTAVQDPSLTPYTRKVHVIVSPEIKGRFAALVEVKTKSGDLLSKRVDSPKGQPDNPMTPEEGVAKFKNCGKHAAYPLAAERLNHFIQKARTLEELASAAELVQPIIYERKTVL